MAEKITVNGTQHSAWTTGNDDWQTSWTGPTLYSRKQAVEMVLYAATLEESDDHTGSPGQRRSEISPCEVEAISAALLPNHEREVS